MLMFNFKFEGYSIMNYRNQMGKYLSKFVQHVKIWYLFLTIKYCHYLTEGFYSRSKIIYLSLLFYESFKYGL